MTTTVEPGSIYEECAHLKRTKPTIHANKELEKKLAEHYDILPNFESSVFDHIYMKHYSMTTNERLRCYWRCYLNKLSSRVFSPFQFPNNRHFHFHNNTIRYLPSELLKLDSRMKLKVGPGVDARGQIPIPQELFMKRGKLDYEKPKNNIKRNSKKIKGRLTKGE